MQVISSKRAKETNASVKVGGFYRTPPLLTRILPYFYNAPPSDRRMPFVKRPTQIRN
jgi:hypothetical protein